MPSKKVAFRVDASSQIGSGHLMRCLTLAAALKKQGFYVLFICRNISRQLQSLVESNYELKILIGAESTNIGGTLAHSNWLRASQEVDLVDSEKALGPEIWDWVVVDHYAIDCTWESELKKKGLARRILVIDDLADRMHDCDVLLDQNLGRACEDYANLVPDNCVLLVGPLYALVRDEFLSLRQKSLKRRKKYKLENILITMGGSDSLNVSGQLIDALSRSKLSQEIVITVVMGQSAEWLSEVQLAAESSSLDIRIIVSAENMGQLMFEADLCIGAAGSTSWERCTLGVPSILFCIADNQKSVIDALLKSGAVLAMDLSKDYIDSVALIKKITEVSYRSHEMIKKSASIADGEGVRRVISNLSA